MIENKILLIFRSVAISFYQLTPYFAIALILGLAVWVTVMKIRRRIKGQSGCSNCSGCQSGGCPSRQERIRKNAG